MFSTRHDSIVVLKVQSFTIVLCKFSGIVKQKKDPQPMVNVHQERLSVSSRRAHTLVKW